MNSLRPLSRPQGPRLLPTATLWVAALALVAGCGQNTPTPSAGGGANAPAVQPGAGGEGDAEGGKGAPGGGGLLDGGGGDVQPGGEGGGGAGETPGESENPSESEGSASDVEGGGVDIPELCPDGSARPLNGECDDLEIPDPLQVLEISPQSGPVEGGTTVTILGTGFVRPTTVTVAGKEIGIDPVRTGEELRFETPSVKAEGISGLVSIEIANGSGNIVIADAFNYFDEVRLDGVTPATGPSTGGETVRLEGAGFDDTLVVSFGERTAADIHLESPTVALVTTPKGEAGAVDVRAFTDTGQALLEDAYTYVAAVGLAEVTPNAGSTDGGTIITLTGGGFSMNSVVTLGNLQATILGASEDGSTITATTPRSDETGAVDVRVSDAGGDGLLRGAFSYYDRGDDRVRMYSVVPPTGTTRGGETVLVVGHNFDASTEVIFGNSPADCRFIDAQSVECTTPAAAGPGFVNVTAEAFNGQATLNAGFQYRPPLEVTNVAPSSGPVAGGTRITVRGTGFDADTTLSVGVSPGVDVRVLDPTTLIANTPPGSAGPADLTVTRGDGARTVAEGAFQYTDSLRLLAVAPAEGAMAGGSAVTLLGTGFVPGSRLTFGGAAAVDVQVDNGASLRAITPPGQPGDVDVVLTTPGGEQATLEDGFTYFNPTTLYGGTWGDAIDGAVNITVLDASTGEGIGEAFCMLGTERGGGYEGRTDGRGQITFSGDDVFGRQMITCGKEGYANASVVRFDAENVSVYLFPPPPPPSMGPMGPGPQPATVSGLVWGIDKYLKPRANPEEGWVAVAYVETTTESMHSDNRPDPGPGWMVFDDGPYEIRARLGDLAAVAIGGILNENTGEFRPIRMGAARWLFGISGERIEEAHIELNIPMENTAGLRFDSPPLGIDGPPDWMVVEPSILFDADGSYPLWQYINVIGEPIEAGLELARMPALVNALEDTSITFRVEFGDCDDCREDPRGIKSPYTNVFVRDVESLVDEIDVTPILGIPRQAGAPPRVTSLTPQPLLDDTLEWEILGGSDLPTGQNNILFRFNADGDAVPFWDMYFRGDQTHMVLPDLQDIHGIERGELLAILFISTYVDGFDLDNFEYGDFSISNRRARSLSVGWLTY